MSSDARPKAGRAKDLEHDKAFAATLKLPDGSDQAFTNGDAAITNARCWNPFSRRLSVQAEAG
jgi:hypothetical protein